jgi:hypothetical protein
MKMGKETPTYSGFNQDTHGITMLGRLVLDGWLFGLIPREEDCAGWDLQRMQGLTSQVEAKWDEYGNLPSRLPDDLRARHAELYEWATERARNLGWDPTLAEDE